MAEQDWVELDRSARSALRLFEVTEQRARSDAESGRQTRILFGVPEHLWG